MEGKGRQSMGKTEKQPQGIRMTSDLVRVGGLNLQQVFKTVTVYDSI